MIYARWYQNLIYILSELYYSSYNQIITLVPTSAVTNNVRTSKSRNLGLPVVPYHIVCVFGLWLLPERSSDKRSWGWSKLKKLLLFIRRIESHELKCTHCMLWILWDLDAWQTYVKDFSKQKLLPLLNRAERDVIMTKFQVQMPLSKVNM